MKINFRFIRFVMYILLIIFLIYLKNTDVNINCFWASHYNILCPSCGITRATKCILQLNFLDAIKFNTFYTCVLLPFILFLISNDIYHIIFNKKTVSFIEIILGCKVGD